MNAVNDMKRGFAMKTLYFDGEQEIDRTPISHFRLIEEQNERVEVFIELNDEAKTVFQRYEKIIRMEDQWERQQAFADIKSDFYQYIISIPKQVDNKPPIVNGIGYIALEQLADFYDMVLGYKTVQTGLIW